MIAGGGGFLGSAIARNFAKRGWRVLTLGLGAPHGVSGLPVTHHEGLISRDLFAAAAKQAGQPDIVIHSAGGASVGRSWEDPRGDFELSVASTAEILDFIRQDAPSARLLLVSSAAVYGNQPKAVLSETDPAVPLSPYGLHKHVCEQLVMGEARMNGTAASIVRLFSIYGEGLRKQILWDILSRTRAAPGEPLELWGTGEETRDFLHAEDAAELIVRAAGAAVPGKVRLFNGASGTPISVRDLAGQMIQTAGLSVPLVFNGRTREGDPLHLRADASYASSSLGFRPTVSLALGLKRYADWFNRKSEREA
jgi:UDP-glucose 4-epimerase